jgi:hypothetical protein
MAEDEDLKLDTLPKEELISILHSKLDQRESLKKTLGKAMEKSANLVYSPSPFNNI